jgi:hypothetical protein
LSAARAAADAALRNAGLKPASIRALRRGEASTTVAEEIAKARSRGVAIIPINDPRFPLPPPTIVFTDYKKEKRLRACRHKDDEAEDKS